MTQTDLFLVDVLQKQHKENGEGELDESIDSAVELEAAMAALSLPSKELPPPHPPTCRKRDLYLDPSVFEELDEHVFKVRGTPYKDLEITNPAQATVLISRIWRDYILYAIQIIYTYNMNSDEVTYFKEDWQVLGEMKYVLVMILICML